MSLVIIQQDLVRCLYLAGESTVQIYSDSIKLNQQTG